LVKLVRIFRAARTLQLWQNRLNISYSTVELLKVEPMGANTVMNKTIRSQTRWDPVRMYLMA
jgi:hypothetical protein